MNRSSSKKGADSVYGRASVADFICPDNGYRGRQLRRGIVPKDHMKENYRQLRATQINNFEQKIKSKMNKSETYTKLIEFRNVPSRVYQESKLEPPLTSRTSDTGVFLMKGTNNRRLNNQVLKGKAARREVEKQMVEAEMYTTAIRPSTPRKDAVPKATETAMLAPRSKADWVASNKMRAQTIMPPSPSKSTISEDFSNVKKHKAFGKVPSYLQQRKSEWKIEKDRIEASKPDKDCPPGMTLMDDDERLATLETLQQSKIECMKILSKMPIVLETLSMKERQTSLENKLKEIESAIGIFSKAKVFIAKEV